MKKNQKYTKPFKLVRSNTANIASKAKNYIYNGEKFFKKYPLVVLGVLLGLLLITVIISNSFRTQESQVQTEAKTQKVSVYRIGTTPKIEVFATVERTGVITIAAQTPGIVRNILVKPGDEIGAGKSVVSLASNYYGGNALSLQRQLAQKQFEYLEESYPKEIELIEKQRSIARSTDNNSDELRSIQEKSLTETGALISLNESIIAQYDSVISTSTVSAEILAAKQAKSQYSSATNQLKQALRQAEYQSAADKPPAELSESQKNLVLSQLDLKEKALSLNKEVTELQLKLARVQEAQMYPASPFAGTVEHVHVREGQQVSPGTPLVTLYCDKLETQLHVEVPYSIASSVSSLEASTITIGDKTLTLYPNYVSRVATTGSLFSIEYSVPLEYAQQLADASKVAIQIPVGSQDTSAVMPYVPVDAVHINENSSEVFVIEDGLVVARKVTLGAIQGRYVFIEDGVNSGDAIILDRFVLPGDSVEIITQ